MNEMNKTNGPSEVKSKQILIGITGSAGSGKSTVVALLRLILPILGRGVHPMSLADPLKNFVEETFGFPGRTLRGPSSERSNKDSIFGAEGPSAQEALQRLGTDWGRAQHPDVWIRYLDRRRRSILKNDAIVIIPDIRFDNEAEWIISEGGEVWKTDARQRLSFERRKQKRQSREWQAHASEDGVSDTLITRTIDTNGPEEDLPFKVLRLVAQFAESNHKTHGLTSQSPLPLSLFT